MVRNRLCLDVRLDMQNHWIKFRDSNNLTNKSISIPSSSDPEDIHEVTIFDTDSILDERDNFYPGLVVAKDGYIPVGGCEIGSGDPYFVNLEEGEDSALYQIYHDEVSDQGYSKDDAVCVVLRNFKDILNCIN